MTSLSRILTGKADAMEARERLARFYAEWTEVQFLALSATRQFRTAVARLAREVGMTTDQVLADVRADAEGAAR